MKKIRAFLGGSGALYAMFAGCLRALQDTGHEIVEVNGTSGGSIIAASWACSDVPKDKENLIRFLKETLPKNHPGTINYSLTHFIKKWGLVDGSHLEKVFESVFYEKLGQSTIPLRIFAADVTRNRQIVFSSQDNPDMSTAKAVRAACSIPLVFDPTEVGGEKIVDGGWICPMPDSNVDAPAIGFEIFQAKPDFLVESLIDYIQNVMYRKIMPPEEEKKNIVSLFSSHDRKNIAGTTEEQVEEIFEEGYEQTIKHLEEQNNGK